LSKIGKSLPRNF